MLNCEAAFEKTTDYLKLAAEYGSWVASNHPKTERIKEIEPLVLGSLKQDIYQTVGREMETCKQKLSA